MSRDESRRSKRCRPDRDFELGPNSRILMGDYDDERTLDEEEALEGSEDTHNELSHLQKESDMPLKDLLVMYGYSNMDCQDPNKAEDEEEEEDEEEDEEDDEEDEDDEDPTSYEPDLKQFYTEMVKAEENGGNVKRATTKAGDSARTDNPQVLTPNVNPHTIANSVESKTEENSGVNSMDTSGNPSADGQSLSEAVDGNPSAAGTNVSSAGGGGSSSRLLRSVSRPQSEEEEEDGDYTPDEEEWKKTIMVGSDYQAAIPEGLCKYDDALPYENEDKMLWDPSPISEEQVEEFLKRAQQPAVKGISLPRGNHVRDDEQALYLLLQCGYNLEEALRRRRMNVLPSTESVSIWSEEECHNFETGIRSFGKDFYSIHKHKVRTRSVGELVQFYYLWKKTERHDIFTYKARMEKKKYAFHPGVTDYMDRFLEEQEGVRDRSSSPNVNYLMHTDKRQRVAANLTGNEEPSSGNCGISKPNHDNWEMDSTNTSGGNKASLDNWNASANSSAATAGSVTPSMPTSGSSNTTNEPTSVNSEHVDSLTHDHLHNSSASAIAAASQLDYAKVNSSAGVESNTSCAAVTPWPSLNTSTNTTIAPISSSSNSAAAAPMLQQQQQQSNQLLHMQQQQVTNLPLNKSNENDTTLSKARTPENILPHLPP